MRGGVGMEVCRLGEWKKGNKGKRKGRKESAGRVRKRRRRREEEARGVQGRAEQDRAGERQAGGRRHDRNEAQGRLGAVQTEFRQGWVDSWPGAEH